MTGQFAPGDRFLATVRGHANVVVVRTDDLDLPWHSDVPVPDFFGPQTEHAERMVRDPKRTPVDPTPVRRVETATGSHIEPPLDPDADDLAALAWHCGVLLADTGIAIRVTPTGRRTYMLSRVGWGYSDMPFRDCWTFINGVSSGAAWTAGTPSPERQNWLDAINEAARTLRGASGDAVKPTRSGPGRLIRGVHR